MCFWSWFWVCFLESLGRAFYAGALGKDGRRPAGKLVHSLLEQYNGLVGMSQAEVEALLGSDADGEQVEEQLTTEGSTVRPLLVYQAGGRSWAMFPEYLFIYLEDGYVTEAKLIAD